MKNYLVTGGAGFIGSNFVEYIVQNKPNSHIIVLDKLTYAGNKENLKEVEDKIEFIQGDIKDRSVVEKIFSDYEIDYVVNFAAESHVDNSIADAQVFIETNVLGTQNLLEIAKEYWEIEQGEYKAGTKFIQVSTDEVYGSLGERGYFTESSSLQPSSPYSASKASADLIAQSYYKTYNFPVVISRCSNNYGPRQYPEKLIPVMIQNIIAAKKLPVYGDGTNIRDWIYVKDHVRALEEIVANGKKGEVYNIGANTEKKNLDIVRGIIDIIKELTIIEDKYKNILSIKSDNINYDLIEFVEDRLGHDWRYAIDNSKIKQELNWQPRVSFYEGLKHTVKWYLENQDWIEKVK